MLILSPEKESKIVLKEPENRQKLGWWSVSYAGNTPLSIVLLHFLVKARLWQEERRIQRLFYGDPLFAACDLALKKAYRKINPYRLSKKFLQTRGETEVDVYGETYLTTLDLIARVCGVSEKDTVVELGCGRGRGVFFLSRRYGCTVRGIDWIPEFITLAQEIAKCHSVEKVHFSCEDMMAADLAGATVIYLYGTCLKEEEILQLLHPLEQLKPGTTVATVSYPLSDYSSRFIVTQIVPASFPWGQADIYICTKVSLFPLLAEEHRPEQDRDNRL
jgi:SAM-dependent methyltransferase